MDPVALEGGFNSTYGVDWYGYGLQNPLRWVDPWGLQVAACPAGSSCQGCVWIEDMVVCPGGPIPIPPIIPIIPPDGPIPIDPSKPLPLPRPDGECRVEQPQKPVPPPPPRRGCKGEFDVCMGFAAAAPTYAGRVARAAGCAALYVACIGKGGGH